MRHNIDVALLRFDNTFRRDKKMTAREKRLIYLITSVKEAMENNPQCEAYSKYLASYERALATIKGARK